jgi:elongation factor G
VISLAVTPKSTRDWKAFSKAMARFQREDPTFQVSQDSESNETVISGMGELHLQIYLERLEREYKVKTDVSPPRVRYRETVAEFVKFDHLLKKQTGGSGQYARVVGTLEPMEYEDETGAGESVHFEDATVGGSIPPQYMSACQKGFQDAITEGPMAGNPVIGINFVLTDGQSHSVDSR